MSQTDFNEIMHDCKDIIVENTIVIEELASAGIDGGKQFQGLYGINQFEQIFDTYGMAEKTQSFAT